MRKSEIAALRAKALAATPGPWILNMSEGYGINTKDRHIALVSYFQAKKGDKEENEANAHYIHAASPDVVLKLIERIDTIEAKCAWQAEMLDRFCSLLDNKPGPGDSYGAIFEYREVRKKWRTDLKKHK